MAIVEGPLEGMVRLISDHFVFSCLIMSLLEGSGKVWELI